MKGYDFNDFLLAQRGQLSREEVAEAASKLSDILNSLIVVGIKQPDIFCNGEARFGTAQLELAKLARELRA